MLSEWLTPPMTASIPPRSLTHRFAVRSGLAAPSGAAGMVISAEEHCIKPSPSIYQILLERFGLNASDCVFIDDRQPNVDGADAVGMTGILFTRAQDLREKLESVL